MTLFQENVCERFSNEIKEACQLNISNIILFLGRQVVMFCELKHCFALLLSFKYIIKSREI